MRPAGGMMGWAGTLEKTGHGLPFRHPFRRNGL